MEATPSQMEGEKAIIDSFTVRHVLDGVKVFVEYHYFEDEGYKVWNVVADNNKGALNNFPWYEGGNKCFINILKTYWVPLTTHKPMAIKAEEGEYLV